MTDIFSECTSSSILIPDISRWNASNVINMSYAFYRCSSLSCLPDISNWDTFNVVYMNHMFYNCSLS